MTTKPNCPECDIPLPADAPHGLCPKCLLRHGMDVTLTSSESQPAAILIANPTPLTSPATIRYFGDYELGHEIARGGMGAVFKARQVSLNRPVAVKMILERLLANKAMVKRFQTEAEAAANLDHPNIVAIHQIGAHDGQHYFSMEYVEGKNLAQLADGKPLAPARAARYVQGIANGIHYAHQRGTLHRDLKPSNVLIDKNDQPRITDFGLAKLASSVSDLTVDGAVMGTPSYMSPEQAAGHQDQIGPHSDVYSLGAILYELLTGKPPFQAATQMATVSAVIESGPIPPRRLNPDLPLDIETICLKCLEKSPQRRYQSADELAEELGRFLKGEPILARSAAPSTLRIPLWMKVFIAVALGTFLGMYLHWACALLDAAGNPIDKPLSTLLGKYLKDGISPESWPVWLGVKVASLNLLGALVIKLLKALAIPLMLFAILDSFVKSSFTFKQGAKLVGICLINVSVAMILGLTIMNVFRPGAHWVGQLDILKRETHASAIEAETIEKSRKLSFLQNLDGYVPKTLIEPLADTNVIPVVLLALFIGPALRRARRLQSLAGRNSVAGVENFIETAYEVLVIMLGWAVQLVPYAMFFVLAKAVGDSGLGVFKYLWIFMAAILSGLLLHALVYYTLVAWLVGGKRPGVFLGKGIEAILAAFSSNSSLIALPLTLRSLDRMGVSPQSARLGACMGTQLNNDGIMLYEAMAALFMAQAIGLSLGLGKQITIVLASIMAGAGVAGIPEAGFIVLPLVLGAAGITADKIALILPLVMITDWLIARVRSVVNVMADMVVSILMDVGVRR